MEKLEINLGSVCEGITECVLTCYLAQDKRVRDSVLVLPGGGYNFVSIDREGHPVALRFLGKGFNTFVLNYSTADRFPNDKFPMQLLQAGAAIKYIRDNAKSWDISGKVAVCGFSAGGHLAASISLLHSRDYVLKALNISENQVRPDASILCYAVISSFVKPHQGSINNLAGQDESIRKEVSLENQIDENAPPTFLWHTADDAGVDVSNSLNYALNLSNNKVPFELHIFQSGPHGLALCDETTAANPKQIDQHIAKWIDLAEIWLKKSFSN